MTAGALLEKVTEQMTIPGRLSLPQCVAPGARASEVFPSLPTVRHVTAIGKGSHNIWAMADSGLLLMATTANGMPQWYAMVALPTLNDTGNPLAMTSVAMAMVKPTYPRQRVPSARNGVGPGDAEFGMATVIPGCAEFSRIENI